MAEFPVSINRYFKVNWPLGGGYFRLSPAFFLKKQIISLLKGKNNSIASVYLHPWEFDNEQPRIKNVRKSLYFRHYCGLKNTKQKFANLIDFIKNDIHADFMKYDQLLEADGK